MSDHFDYIFAGAGMSALSLVCRMMDDPYFENKRILLLDADTKKSNDRTWSFWDTKPSYFDHLVHKRWNKVSVLTDKWSKTFSLKPYTYKMIRGIDFYNHAFDRISEFENIIFRNEKIIACNDGEICTVETNSRSYTATTVFDSIFDLKTLKEVTGSPVLYQHFKGYIIELKEDQADDVVTFMDFSINQEDTLQFMYVLPFNARSCLVEHTYFSQYFVSEATYDEALQRYCDDRFGPSAWQIAEVETGVIPMTSALRQKNRAQNIVPIGTKGGFTKASSGYTFYFVQKAAREMIDRIKKNQRLTYKSNRFDFYDALLLRVLARDEGYGHQLFSKLFQTTTPELVFTFLNEESSLLQDLGIITRSPTLKFVRALFEEIWHKVNS